MDGIFKMKKQSEIMKGKFVCCRELSILTAILNTRKNTSFILNNSIRIITLFVRHNYRRCGKDFHFICLQLPTGHADVLSFKLICIIHCSTQDFSSVVIVLKFSGKNRLKIHSLAARQGDQQASYSQVPCQEAYLSKHRELERIHFHPIQYFV